MGDFNINLLNVATHQKTNDFIDNVIAKGFIPYITKPTRITSTTATLIDHLYSNHTHTEYDSGIIITYMTDLFGIFHLIYGIPTVHNIKYKQTRQLNECNILKFRNLLAKADYTSVLSAIDPNEAYNNFMQIYKSLFEISCPVKTTKINNKYIKREPWITSGLLVSSINKDKLLRRKLHKPNMERERENAYRAYCRIYNKTKRAAKTKYYAGILEERKYSIKDTWIILR